MAFDPSPSESGRFTPWDSMMHTMLLTLLGAIVLSCLWVLLAAQPAQ